MRILWAKSPWGGNGGDNDDNSNTEENIFTRPRKKMRNFFSDFNPSPKFEFSSKTLLLVISAIIGLWLASGIYEVKEGEQAIIIRFGKYSRVAFAGLNYHLPDPIERVVVEKVNSSRRIEIGYRSTSGNKRNVLNETARDVTTESVMLTGDENIAIVNCDVRWHIKNLHDMVFNLVSPEDTVKVAAQSALREVIARTPIASVLSNRKQEIADEVQELTQAILDTYQAGVEIEEVQLLKAEPPLEVIDAYRDVQTSKADKERGINEAQAYSNNILPVARGEAAQILQEAEAYKQEVISRAEGDTQRFDAVLQQYQANKQITRDRLYLDAVEEILKGSNKVITASDILPHMAINPKP